MVTLAAFSHSRIMLQAAAMKEPKKAKLSENTAFASVTNDDTLRHNFPKDCYFLYVT